MARVTQRMKCESWMLLAALPRLLCGARVEALPGYGPPPTAHHSGFVEVDAAAGTNLFYYFVESQSNPDADPLLWWMNGGPGASSLVGLLAENGPLLLNEAGNLVSNPYAWNLRANVLYVEFGPGVGYSYCSNSSKTNPASPCLQSRSDCSPCSASDTLVAQQNLVFIEQFLSSKFPSLAGRPLYIAGESYAGVYIPTLAASLVEHFQNTSVVNLHGLWITDPCVDNHAQFGWLDLGLDFSYQKGLISKITYDTLTSPEQRCSSGRTAVGDYIRNVSSDTCRRAWRLYDLATAGVGSAVHPRNIPALPMYIDPLNAFGPAGGADLPGYFSRSDVREALHASASPNKVYHIELGNNGYSNYKLEYAACNLAARTSQKSMLSIYRRLIEAAKSARSASNLKRIVISSGDIDPVVALHGTEAAVHAIGLPVLDGGDRRPWFYNATATASSLLVAKPTQWGPSLRGRDAGVQVGGFVTNFDSGVPGLSLDFVTMRFSGHMVPAYAPQKALHVIYSLLLQGRALSPLLPADFGTSSDNSFYGWQAPRGGTFTAWVTDAMTAFSSGAEPKALDHVVI